MGYPARVLASLGIKTLMYSINTMVIQLILVLFIGILVQSRKTRTKYILNTANII